MPTPPIDMPKTPATPPPVEKKAPYFYTNTDVKKTFRRYLSSSAIKISKQLSFGYTNDVRQSRPTELMSTDSDNMSMKTGTQVSTVLGTGVVQGFRKEDGYYIVKLVSSTSTEYISPTDINHEVKAVVGERVSTKWGPGTIIEYYPKDQLYEIELDWRWDDAHIWKMKATVAKFEKLVPSMMERTGSYLKSWKSTIVIPNLIRV